MKKTINAWQRGMASAFGGFIGIIFISRQFSNDWLWVSVGLIVGLFAGWMVAMFADNPKGFTQALKDAFAAARKVFSVDDYGQAKLKTAFIFWYVMGSLAIFGTAIALFVIVSLCAAKTLPPFIYLIILIFAIIVAPIVVGVLITKNIPTTEQDVTNIKKMAYRGNLIGLTYYTVVHTCRGCVWTWKHRTDIRRAIGVFIAKMFLYFHENAGLAILTNVALALGVGQYYGYVAGVAVGFISGVTGAVIYNKGQDRLRTIVAKSS